MRTARPSGSRTSFTSACCASASSSSGSEVNDEIANRICAELLLLAADDPDRDIWLYINSPGGSVTAGMAIYDMMQYVPNDVATVAMGLAASMGQFLLSRGRAGQALRAAARAHHDAPAVRRHRRHRRGHRDPGRADALHQEDLAERIAYHTGQPLEQIEADSDRDRWFTAEEAKDYGFIDQVVRSARQVPSQGAVS